MTEHDVPPPIYLINPHAPTQDLFEFAARRFLSVRNLMESLTCVTADCAEGKDLNVVADVAYQLLQQGCEVLDLAQGRLMQ